MVAKGQKGFSVVGALITCVLVGALASAASTSLANFFMSLKKLELKGEQLDLARNVRKQISCASTVTNCKNGSIHDVEAINNEGNVIGKKYPAKKRLFGRYAIHTKCLKKSEGYTLLTATYSRYVSNAGGAGYVKIPGKNRKIDGSSAHQLFHVPIVCK